MRVFRLYVITMLLLGAQAKAEPVLLTENLPPLQVVSNGKVVSGLAYQRVQQLLAIANVQVQPEVLPWARLYKRLKTEPNVLVFSLVRTAEREEQFIWLAPLFYMELSIYSLAERNLVAGSLKEMSTYITGVKRDDVVADYLLKQNFKFGSSLFEVKNTEDTVKLLLRKRVDFIPATPLIIQAVCQTLGCTEQDFKLNFTIEELPQKFYLAASLGTSPDLVARIQQAAAQLSDALPQLNELELKPSNH
jgi:polar amino acid transport system substrate-binding protein